MGGSKLSLDAEFRTVISYVLLLFLPILWIGSFKNNNWSKCVACASGATSVVMNNGGNTNTNNTKKKINYLK